MSACCRRTSRSTSTGRCPTCWASTASATLSGGSRPERFGEHELAGLLAEVGDDWDVEDRAVAALHRLGLSLPDPLGRSVGTLSGGEVVLAGLARLLLRPSPVTLLDEPTNNLDRRARGLLYDAIGTGRACCWW